MRGGAEDVVEDCFLLRGREFGLVRHVWDDDAPLGRRVVANWFWGMAGGASSEIQAPPPAWRSPERADDAPPTGAPLGPQLPTTRAPGR